MSADRFRSLLVWVAGGALLAAVAVDSLAMIGRQTRVPLIGSIEIVEAVVLVAACGALIIATLERAHARVNILLDHVPPAWRAWLRRIHALAAVLLFAALLVGSAWIAVDLWGGHEESELLRIPYWPLRIIVVLALAGLLVLAALGLRDRNSDR
jgi:TRAP-type C4-dicarboxylate transport system permease small subunit